MRTIWTILSIVVFVNALALAGFVGWLAATDRIDRQRLNAVVELFKPTVAQRDEQVVEAEAQAQEQEQAAAEAARIERIKAGPTHLQYEIDQRALRDDVMRQRYERFKREIEDLHKNIETARKLLDQQRAELDAKQKAFDEALRREKQVRADADFLKAVQMYEQLRASQTKEIFKQLIAQQNTADVVDFLAAMQQRKAAAVIKEFKTDEEIPQAAELIERLRHRGVDFLERNIEPAESG